MLILAEHVPGVHWIAKETKAQCTRTGRGLNKQDTLRKWQKLGLLEVMDEAGRQGRILQGW